MYIQPEIWLVKLKIHIGDNISHLNVCCNIWKSLGKLHTTPLNNNMPGGHDKYKLHYTDNATYLATSQKTLHTYTLIEAVDAESGIMGLRLKRRKSEVMVISLKGIMLKCTIKGNGINLEVQKCKYVGTWIASDEAVTCRNKWMPRGQLLRFYLIGCPTHSCLSTHTF